MSTPDSARKFDATRAAEYLVQSRIALAGYEACHELAACLLAVTLGDGATAEILVVGAGGGGQEICTAGPFERNWRFTGVDPSQAMMDITTARLAEADLLDRTSLFVGSVDDLPAEPRFDAATLIGVLHHVQGDEAKRSLLRSIAARIKPHAPFVLAGNRYAYATKPILLAAWGERWRMKGALPDQVKAKLGTMLQGADPPASDDAVATLLSEAGFEQPTLFFSSLFWGAWLTRRRAAV